MVRPLKRLPDLGQGVARAIGAPPLPQVLLKPIVGAAPCSILASIDLPFANVSTSRLDFGLPSAGAYATDFGDLRPHTAIGAAPATRHRPSRRSWAGDPFTRRARQRRGTVGKAGQLAANAASDRRHGPCQAGTRTHGYDGSGSITARPNYIGHYSSSCSESVTSGSGGSGGRSGGSSSGHSRNRIDNTLTWRGATFPWVSRFAQ